MILGFLCSMALAFGTPRTIEWRVFADRDPSTLFAPGSGRWFQVRDFSGALTRGELAERVAKLPIPDEVRQAIVTCAAEKYPTYLADHDAVASRHARKYLDLDRELAVQSENDPGSITVEQIREQAHEADLIERELVTTERNFLQSVQDCLDAASVGAGGLDAKDGSVGAAILESFFLRAECRYSATSISRFCPQRGTDLDLRSMIDQLNLDMPVRKSVEADVLEYERTWSALKSAQSKAWWGGFLQTRKLIDQSRAGTINRTAMASQMDTIARAPSKIGIQMRDASIEASERIEPKLPARPQQVFRRLAHAKIYPEIANDPTGDALRAKFTAVLARKGLPKDTAERIAVLRSTWESEFNAWRSSAEALLLEWSDCGASLAPQKCLGQHVRIWIEELAQKRNEIHENWQDILDGQIPDAATASAQN